MQLKENEGKNGVTVNKYWHSERTSTDFKYVNIDDGNRASAETSGATKIRPKKKRKNKSRKLKEYFNIHEKVGQIFIAILVISFLYSVGYFLEYWHATNP
jgi:hypothetical protein